MSRSLSLSQSSFPSRVPIFAQQLCQRPSPPVLFRYPTYSSRVSLESRYGMCLLLPLTREEISPTAAGSAWSPDTGCACSCRPPGRRSHLQQSGQLGVPIRDVLALAVHQGGDLTCSSRVSLESPIRDVLALAVHQGGDLTCSSRVSLESRYGMCLLLPSTREEMTFPRADSDRLILVASFNRSPVAPGETGSVKCGRFGRFRCHIQT